MARMRILERKKPLKLYKCKVSFRQSTNQSIPNQSINHLDNAQSSVYPISHTLSLALIQKPEKVDPPR